MRQKMETEQTSNRWQHLLKGLSNVVGVLVMLFLANKWSNYLQTLHENELWFSNIKEVEREISFRTEQGFYYSYFKHLVKAPSLWEGKESLERDNLTEHLNTINVFQRFNIHQELFLAAIYNIYNFHLEPIFFYAEAVFSLQGLLLGALYLIAWKLSGTWLAGVLTTAFVVCNRFEVTRVEFTIALREHFALPFIFAQYAAIGHYMTVFNKKINAKTHFNNEQVHLVLIYLLTLMFSVSWQFAQFILLLQSVVLLILGTIQILDKDQVCKILFVNLMSMLTVWYLQFYQPMVLSSLVVSFIPVAIASLQSQGVRSPNNSGILPSLIQSIIRTFFVLVAAVAVNIMAKVALNQNDDNHIFSFVKSKLGFIDETNFESRMYRCLPAFQAMHFAFYVKMTNALLMPLYLMYVGSRCLFIVASVFNNWSLFETEVAKKKKDDDYDQKKKDSTVSGKGTNVDGSAVIEADFLTNPLAHMDARPAECFHVCQSLVLGAMAMTTLRMKCLWCPYICVMASVMLCDRDLWRFVTKRLIGTSVQVENSEKQTPSTPKTGQKNSTRIISSILRHFVLIFAIMILVNNNKDNIYKELEDLKEFWDPDTVDLMEWIQASTPPTAAFTGSMQLLAGVRLCTWRPITNHPHFEDKALRDRTKELYSIYAKISPEKVHKILTKYNSSYIILEDSICLQAGRHTDRCSLPDTMDLALGHIPDDGIVDLPHLKSSKYPRFCKEIRYGAAAYGKLFKKVFENKTFRVYKVV